MHERSTVTVSNQEIAIGQEGDIGGTPLVLVPIDTTLHGAVRRPHHGSIETRLDDLPSSSVAVVDPLSIGLGSKVEAVSTARKLWSPGLDESTVWAEDTDRMPSSASLPHGVGHVDTARTILGKTMSVSKGDSVGRHEPVMLAAPSVGAFAEDDR